MVRRDARQRARNSTGIGQERGELQKKALDRAHEADDDRFYLEAIALIEASMADRLEAVISVLDGQPCKFDTAGVSVRELQRKLASPPDVENHPLFNAVRRWSQDRARWIHEFAKVSSDPRSAEVVGVPGWRMLL